MRFRRGKIIAVALLCVISSLLFSGLTAWWSGWQNLSTRAADTDVNPTALSFDELYEWIPFAATDTGEIVIGQRGNTVTTFALRNEYYTRNSLNELLNTQIKRGFSSMQEKRERDPRPLFSSADMRTMIEQRNVDGQRVGGTVDAPVIMLDETKDDVVVFELLNLTNPPDPESMKMWRNGEPLPWAEVPANTKPDDVYGGVETPSYDGSDIMVYDIGAVAYSKQGMTAIRGIFNREGYYEFAFSVYVDGNDGMLTPINFAFSFYIVHKSKYADAYPHFNLANRATGKAEVYNYSYGSEYPEVRYDNRYFDVVVEGLPDFNGKGENNPGAYQFYYIGEYRMTSTLMYNYSETKKIPVSHYRSYTSALNILGFQAYYGGWHEKPQYSGPKPFFDTEDSSNSSDISAWVKNLDSSSLPFLTSEPHASDVLDYAERLKNLLVVSDLKPVQTNFPPVKFVGNVDYATGYDDATGQNVILATQAFHGVNDYEGSTKKWHISTLDVGKPFATTGEYIITIFFRVNGKLSQQTFYFEITNSVDLKFRVGDEELTLDRLVRNELFTSEKDVTLLYNSRPKLGSYEVPPDLKLYRAELGSSNYHQKIELLPDAEGKVRLTLDEGHYRLTIEHGAYGQTMSVVEVVVDHQPAKGIIAKSYASRMAGLPENTAVFGPGEVTLQWQDKISGVGYKDVTVTYYNIAVQDRHNDPNADRNYDDFRAGEDLFTASVLSAVTSVNQYPVTKVENGWFLDATFSEQGAGLYKIIIEDELGNCTPFILIIDNSKPTFTQNFTTTDFANVTGFPLEGGENVKIGYGSNKLIARLRPDIFTTEAEQKLYQALLNKLIVTDEIRQNDNYEYLSIPLASVEVSLDSGEYYHEFTYDNNGVIAAALDWQDGYCILQDEHTYYFRVTDVLGNVSEYYALLTNDHSRGMVLAESEALEFDNRGLISSEKNPPNAYTSLVTTKGGMTNRRNVTFSFKQSAFDENTQRAADYRVKSITLDFYRLTYDESSPNYPFAKDPERFLNQPIRQSAIIYQNNNGDSAEILYRIALYNDQEETPSGLYIITREYETFPDDDTRDEQLRQYWFIVDRTGMLTYDDDYQTQLTINFGSKTATAESFAKNHNILSSNKVAGVVGFMSKFRTVSMNQFPDGKTFVNSKFVFPSLVPRFSYISNGQTVNMGEGEIAYPIGDKGNEGPTYQLVIADNARNFSVSLFGGSSQEIFPEGENPPTSANYGILDLILDTGRGTNAWIIKNKQQISNVNMQFKPQNDGSSLYVYITDPTELTSLEFQFSNDKEGFYADVDLDATEETWTATGFTNQIMLGRRAIAPEIGYTNWTYSYNIYNWIADYEMVNDGSSIAVTLITEDKDRTTYQIIFDTQKPEHNLQRVKAQDNLACTLATVPGNYIYGLSNDFIFESDSQNPYLGTQKITYREVYANGEGESDQVVFSLNSGREFARIVGLHDNDLKCFVITELDYAGHKTEYTVQLRGDNYKGDLSFSGTVSDENNLTLGVEMRVREASVVQFLDDNRSFRIECGADYYSVLCGSATWCIDGVSGSGNKDKQFFMDTVNGWIDTAAARGEKCRFTLYDRIGKVKTFEYYNIRENTELLELQAYTNGGSSLILETTNFARLSPLLTAATVADRFKIEVLDANMKPIEENVKFYNTRAITALHDSGLSPEEDYIIKVTDPFGRQVITEYHNGQQKDSWGFVAYGNTWTDANGITYVGDSRGVEFKFLYSVYYVNVYDVNGNQVANFFTAIDGNTTTYFFRPNAYNDTAVYRIQAVGKLSGAVLYEKTFAFDTRLPNAEFKSGTSTVDVTGNPTFTGTVNMHVIKDQDFDFEFTVSYARTYQGVTERITLRPTNAEFVQFDQPGQYVVTIRSQIWAVRTYEFTIANINSALVTVEDDGVVIQASPIMLLYTDSDTGIKEYINNYMFTNNGKVGDNFAENGLVIIPSSNSNRVLLGRNDKAYYDIDHEHNALIWCLAIPALVSETSPEEIYTSKYFFATTGITPDYFSAQGVNLSINDNPVLRNYETYRIEQKLTAAGLTVTLIPGNTLDEHNGWVPYNQFPGNIITVDCLRNGTLIRNFGVGEELTIKGADAGYYEFIVHDMVGNRLKFGGTADRYIILNLSQPMVLINNDLPVTDLIYNDTVEFRISNLADDLLRTHYTEEVFDQYFYITDFVVERDEQELTEYTLHDVTTKSNARTYVWTTKGKYNVNLTYIIGDHMEVKGQYKFEIVPSGLPLLTQSISVYQDIQVSSVRRNGYLVTGYENLVTGDTLSFHADRNPGRYEITLLVDYGLNGKKTKVINFNIGYKSALSTYFRLSTTSGGQTQGAVSLFYYSRFLYQARGEITIYLYKDGSLSDTVAINSATIQNVTEGEMQSITVSDAGVYSVVAVDADGDVVYNDVWVITKAASPLAAIITAIVAGIFGVGLLIFLRMRRRMSVK